MNHGKKYDISGVDLERLGLQAACQEAYERGLSDAGAGGFGAGFGVGVSAAMAGLDAASTVRRGWFHGDHTILQFADGTKCHVSWRHEPGTAYDKEKAVMACMLKRLTGNGYIGVLRMLADEPVRRDRAAHGVPGEACAADFEEEAVPIVADCCEEDPEALAAEPVVVDPTEDEELEKMFAGLAEEPGFGRDVFLP